MKYTGDPLTALSVVLWEGVSCPSTRDKGWVWTSELTLLMAYFTFQSGNWGADQWGTVPTLRQVNSRPDTTVWMLGCTQHIVRPLEVNMLPSLMHCRVNFFSGIAVWHKYCKPVFELLRYWYSYFYLHGMHNVSNPFCKFWNLSFPCHFELLYIP